MFGWLKALFGSMDRQQAAAERAAKAMEDIATDIEGVRDQFRARLGIEAPKPLAVEVHEPEAQAPAKPKGRSR